MFDPSVSLRSSSTRTYGRRLISGHDAEGGSSRARFLWASRCFAESARVTPK